MTAPILFSCTGYASLEDMYRSEYIFVFDIVMRRVGNKAFADDLTQDTFMKVLRSISTYIPQENKTLKDSFKSWISVIARNTAFNYLHRKNIEQTKQNYNTLNRGYNFSNPEEIAQTKEELEGIIQSINGLLNHGVRETSRLWFLEDQSYQEISDQLGIPIGTVMSRLHRGKKQLKKNYQR